MKLETSQQTQAARKILVIGGSTYNEKTPEKISKALLDSHFLEEWAVIIAIHKYLRLRDKEPLAKFEDKIISELSLPDIFAPQICLITNPGHFTVETGYIYVLPDPGLPIDDKYLYTRFIDNNHTLQICAGNSIQLKQDFDNWLEQNLFDYSRKKRQIIHRDFLYEKRDNLPFPPGTSDTTFKKAREKSKREVQEGKLSWQDVLYRDMPCIDKFMSEVAASKCKFQIAALLLCGLFGDGANGLKKIKNSGGYTAVQLPEECCHNQYGQATSSMPTTALQIDSHQTVTLEDKPDHLKLSDWLSRIK